MAQQPVQEQARVPLGAYVPQQTADRLRELAREQDRSTSSLIRRALEDYLRREPREPAR